MRGPSDLPPGITESMIPGCGGGYGPVVAEDFVEITLADWSEWDIGEGESSCDCCGEVVGYYLTGGDPSEPEREAWASCWDADERTWCDDCRNLLIEDGERAQAEMDAAVGEGE